MLPNLFGKNRAKIYTLALALAVVTLACGRKEPPLPPPSLVPAAPGELRVEQRGEEVILSFLFPTNTIGGLALDTFEAAEIYELVRELPEGFFDEEEEEADEESEGEEGEGSTDAESDESSSTDDAEADAEKEEDEAEDDEEEEGGRSKKRRDRKPKKKVYTVDKREFSVAAQVRTRLEGAELAAATEGDRISNRFVLNQITPEGLTAHVFGVKIFRDSKDLISPYSKFVTLVPKTPPPAPSALSIEATAQGIALQWESDTVAQPEKKDDEKEKSESETSSEEETMDEATTDPVAAPPEVDLTGVPEERQILGFHIYRRLSQEPGFDRPLTQIGPDLRTYIDRSAPFDARYVYSVTAIRELDPVIESAIGEEREVDYRDRFAPPVPRNVAALAERGRVRLLWTPRPASDLAGYLVYRIDADGTERLLTPTPMIDSEYIDEAVSSGDRVSYFVVSIDRVGNRSAKSAVTETTVP